MYCVYYMHVITYKAPLVSARSHLRCATLLGKDINNVVVSLCSIISNEGTVVVCGVCVPTGVAEVPTPIAVFPGWLVVEWLLPSFKSAEEPMMEFPRVLDLVLPRNVDMVCPVFSLPSPFPFPPFVEAVVR